MDNPACAFVFLPFPILQLELVMQLLMKDVVFVSASTLNTVENDISLLYN